MLDAYLVVSQSRGFTGDSHGQWRSFQFEAEAIEHAKRMAIENKEPYEVYGISLIGASCLPQSKFIDYRAQSAPVKIDAA